MLTSLSPVQGANVVAAWHYFRSAMMSCSESRCHCYMASMSLSHDVVQHERCHYCCMASISLKHDIVHHQTIKVYAIATYYSPRVCRPGGGVLVECWWSVGRVLFTDGVVCRSTPSVDSLASYSIYDTLYTPAVRVVSFRPAPYRSLSP